MSYELTFTVDGVDQLRRSFSRFADDITDAREPLTEIADDFKEIEKRQFNSEGSSGSGGWARLSPNYATWKARNYPGANILVKSGLLKESLTSDNPWTVREIKPLELTLGTRINYALYHQRGTLKMSSRPPIQLSESDKTRWVKILHEWLDKKSNQEWAGLMPGISAGQSHVGSI